jgi:hypothetical protein
MKKLILIALVAFSFTAIAQSTGTRFGATKNKDNTGAILNYKVVTSADAAGNDTIFVYPNAWETIVRPSANIVDSVNIKAPLTNCRLGDYLTVFVTKGSGAGVIRFPSAYFITTASTFRYVLTASKTAVFRFQFNGVKFIEISKLVEP